MAPRTVSDVGESRLIEEIRRAVERCRLGNPGALGDDAAILPPHRRSRGREIVTTDLLVEGTHWRPHHLTPTQLGHRALAVNLSDIAAMGGQPRWCTLGLAMPPKQPLSWFRGVLRGLIAAAEEFRCPLVGGDLVRSPVPTLAITVGGACGDSPPVRRDTARPGETLCVTGDLGRARLALALLDGEVEAVGGSAAILRRHRRVAPRLREGAALAALGAARAMIDVSDGLLADLGWICRLSGVGAEVDLDHLPVSAPVRRHLAGRGVDPAVWAATSGEEYELLFTTRHRLPDLRAALRSRGVATPVTAIGRTVARRGIRWLRGGRAVSVSPAGLFTHFSQGGGPGLT